MSMFKLNSTPYAQTNNQLPNYFTLDICNTFSSIIYIYPLGNSIILSYSLDTFNYYYFTLCL